MKVSGLAGMLSQAGRGMERQPAGDYEGSLQQENDRVFAEAGKHLVDGIQALNNTKPEAAHGAYLVTLPGRAVSVAVCHAVPAACPRCLSKLARFLAAEMDYDVRQAVGRRVASYWAEMGEDLCSLAQARLLRRLTCLECLPVEDWDALDLMVEEEDWTAVVLEVNFTPALAMGMHVPPDALPMDSMPFRLKVARRVRWFTGLQAVLLLGGLVLWMVALMLTGAL